MTVLGIETATSVTAVGIVRDGKVLADVSEGTTVGHAGQLPAMVTRALGEAAIRLEDVEGLGVSVGPGSFTGLRVGLSFAKGVAFSGGCALVGVGTLDALAAAAPDRYSVVATVLDARRAETYLAVFRREGGQLRRCGSDRAFTPEEAFDALLEEAGGSRPAIVLGDGVARYAEAFAGLSKSGIDAASFSEIPPRGGAVALLAEARFERGERDRLESLVPVYVRASAAERNLRSTSLTTEKAVS